MGKALEEKIKLKTLKKNKHTKSKTLNKVQYKESILLGKRKSNNLFNKYHQTSRI